MTSTHRIFKRTAILSIIFFTIGTVFTVRYFLSRPAETCFDEIRNQDEEGIDCGGICQAMCKVEYHPEELLPQEVSSVPGGEKDIYDVVAKVHNPNDELGASSFRYTVVLKGASGATVGTQSGDGFILPQETKYFLQVNIRAVADPVRAEISFSDMTWEKFSGYQEKPRLSVLNKTYSKISSGPFFSEAVGNILNDSTFDFRSLLVKVILRDASGTPLALNQTEMNTVLSKETREFRLKWPKAFPGEVETIDVEVEADVYHASNFIERYLPQGRFQEMQQ
jgi:hypothetical protein